MEPETLQELEARLVRNARIMRVGADSVDQSAKELTVMLAGSPYSLHRHVGYITVHRDGSMIGGAYYNTDFHEWVAFAERPEEYGDRWSRS